MSWASIPVAFLAGMVSFLAPCVLPLVPAYLSAVSAVDADRLGQRGTARRVVASSLPFVAGFTAFFVLLGIGAALVGGRVLGDQFLLERVAGFVLVVFGLAFMGLLAVAGAPRRSRVCCKKHAAADRASCSAVLSRSARPRASAPCSPRSSSSPAPPTRSFREPRCSPCYSLGLAVPFVLAAALFTRAMSAFRWLRDHYRAIQIGGGAIMVALGLLLFFERFYVLRVYLNRALERLGLEPAL